MNTRTKLLWAALLLCAWPLGHAWPQQSEEEELFSTAQRAFDDGFHDVAVRYLEEFVPKYPQSSKANQAKLLLGQCYYLKNDFNKALDFFKSVGDAAENKDMLLFWLGETYLKLQDYAQAQGHYRQLLGSFPDSSYAPQALYSLGWLYFDQKQYAQAKDAFSDLISRFPKHQLSEDGFLKIAECMYNAGDYPSAIKEFEQYFLRYPQTTHAAQVHLNMADAYYYMEDFTPAMNAYEKAIKASQDAKLIQTAYIGKIWCAIKKKMYDHAQKWVKEAMEFAKAKNLPSEDLSLAAGNLLYEKNDWEAAVNAYSDLITHFPSGTHRLEAHLGRGNAYYFLKKFPEAAGDFQFVLDYRHPDSDQELAVKANLGLGWAHLKLNAIEQAIRCFQTVFEHANNRETKTNALVQMADAYHDAGKFSEASGIYGEVLKNYADSPLADYVQYRQGIAFLKSAKIESALAAFDRLQQDFPNSKYLEDIGYYCGVAQFKRGNWPAAAARMEGFLKALTHPSDFAPEANYILALAYLNLQQCDEALKIFQKILRLYPDDENVAKNSDIGIAKCQFELGQVKEAVNAYQNIAATNPDYARDAYLKMAQLYRNAQNYDKEIATYAQALNIGQGKAIASNAELFFNMADAYEVMGRLEEAVDHYLKIPAQYPDQMAWVVKAYLRVAKIFEDRKDWEGAKVTYQKIVQLKAEESKYAQERLDWIKKK